MLAFRNVCIILFTIFLVESANAQNISRSIGWQEVAKSAVTIGEDDENGFSAHLRFDDNVHFPLIPQMIPFYAETFTLPNGISSKEQVSLSFSEMEFVALTGDELSLLSKDELELLPTLELDYSVYTSRLVPMLQLSLPALRVNPSNGIVERLVSFSFSIQVDGKQIPTKQNSVKQYAANSVLASGYWQKISVDESGVHRISYSELVAMGFDDLDNISLWGNDGKQLPFWNNQQSVDDLKQIPVFMDKKQGAKFGAGDYIYFYANGPVVWGIEDGDSFFSHHIHDYSSRSHYFLTTDMPNPLRISSAPQPTLEHTRVSSSFDALHFFEKNDTNLVKSGRKWFGENFEIETKRRYSLPFNKPVTNGKAEIRVSVAARSGQKSSFSLYSNGSLVGSITMPSVDVSNQYSSYASEEIETFTINYSQGTLNLDLEFNKPSPSSSAWLDYITVNARQQLFVESGHLLFRDKESVVPNAITRFDIANATSDMMIWDVSDFFNPEKQLNFSLNGTVAQVKVETETLKEFAVFSPSKASKVRSEGMVENQNIHGDAQPEMVIVTHADYLAQANELAQLHRTYSNLSVVVYTNQQVYNEFSSGNADVSAIRNLMRMFYKRANNPKELPRYLLLMGDGSYDNRKNDASNTNRILTYQSENSTHITRTFVSDDYFGLLDDDEGEGQGLVDIGIGRIPCGTVNEATSAVAKIRQYMHGSHGSWHNWLCFIGDDGDANLHMNQANQLAEMIEEKHPHYNIERIFFDAYPIQTSSQGARYPLVTDAINNRVSQGALILNYVGHANTRWLAHEKVLMISDVLSWRNYDRLPLLITATCEFSRFDDYGNKSGGEYAMFAPNGGCIGLVSTTRVVYANPNFLLNKNFLENTFKKRDDYIEGEGDMYYRLGDIIRLAKINTAGQVNKRNFSLLGDPALMLHYPEVSMEINEMNGIAEVEKMDTLMALSKVELRGTVTEHAKSNNFVGEAEITLFDKLVQVSTLGNRGGNPFTFWTRESTIYKGRSSVEGNQFTTSFIVPKDIMYSYGPGRISLFSSNGEITGSGYFEDFIIGGINSHAESDVEGPSIELYMNNEKFVDGGVTNNDPKLVVVLADSSGINTTGTGIGHDITATLTGPENKTFILNDYYIANMDDFTKGRIEYQLSNLKPGEYTMAVKAWDVYNNSSQEQLSFNVRTSSELQLYRVLNYPNPFTQFTSFFFEHNHPYSDMEISIHIFSASGKLVKNIEHFAPSDGGNRVGPIPWDGLDDYGDRIGRGVYFYRLRVKPSDGKAAEVYQKLVILK